MSLTSPNTAQSADEVLVHTMPTSATKKMKIGWILLIPIRSVIPTASIVVENVCLFIFFCPWLHFSLCKLRYAHVLFHVTIIVFVVYAILTKRKNAYENNPMNI